MGQKNATTRPIPTFDHMKKKKAREMTHVVPLSDEAAERWIAAKQEYDRIELTGSPEDAREAKARLQRTKAELADEVVEMRFRALPRETFERLKRASRPATEERVEELKREWGGEAPEFDAEALLVPLLAASCVQPKMTEEQVRELVDSEEWSAAEIQQLFQIALIVNQSVRTLDWDFK